jgi:hypothetical protein
MQRQTGICGRVVGLEPDGPLEVVDRLPQLGFTALEVVVPSEQERLVGVPSDAAGACQTTGFFGSEVRLNLLGDGSRNFGFDARISCAVMRTLPPTRCTEPSRIASTPSSRPISGTVLVVPL